MVLLIFFICVLYIIIGSALGGLYYYLQYKEDCSDMEDMYFLPIWITALWIFVAPLAFAIYYAKRKTEGEEDND